MSHKIRSVRLLWSSSMVYHLSQVVGWEERSIRDDAELLKTVQQLDDSHVDLQTKDGWRCLSSNASRCNVIEVMFREHARLAAEADAERRRRAGVAAKEAAAQAKIDAAAAVAAAQAAEKRAAELARAAATA